MHINDLRNSVLYNLGDSGGILTYKGSVIRRRLQCANSGYLTWAYSAGFWSGAGGAYTVVAEALAAPTPSSNWPTIVRIGGFDGQGTAMMLRIARYLSPARLQFYCAAGGKLYNCVTTSEFVLDSRSHAIVCTSDGTSNGLKIYVDGVAQAVTISDDGDTTPGAPKLYVGGDAANNAGWHGFIASLAMTVGRTWSATEVANYQTTRAFPADPTWQLALEEWPRDSIGGAAGVATGFGSGFTVG